MSFFYEFVQGYALFTVKNWVSFTSESSLESLQRSLSKSGVRPTPSSAPVLKPNAVNFSTRSGMKHIALACGAANGKFVASVVRESVGVSGKSAVSVTIQLPALFVESDHNEDVSKSSQGDKDSGDNIPKLLKVCAIDDSQLICKGYERTLLPKICADDASRVVWCKSHDDVDQFMRLVVGRLDSRSFDRPADIAILDQHLELPKVHCAAPLFQTFGTCITLTKPPSASRSAHRVRLRLIPCSALTLQVRCVLEASLG
jgi:hypothetical protein